MKHFFQKSIIVASVFAFVIGVSSFTKVKKATATAYQITSISTEKNGTGEQQQWTWAVSNPSPGNGDNGTLQDVSHWSIPLSPLAEASLVSAEYSFDQITWISVSTQVDRDPTIKSCTGDDVLKFDVGTKGSEPTYYRVTFDQSFGTNSFATSYIKTGGGRNGCNLYYFAGVGGVTND